MYLVFLILLFLLLVGLLTFATYEALTKTVNIKTELLSNEKQVTLSQEFDMTKNKVLSVNHELKEFKGSDAFSSDIIDLLERFLTLKNAWELYLSNLDPKISEKISDSEFIIGCFTWSKTPQGYEYWFEMNEKWLDYLEQNKINGGKHKYV